MPSPRHWSIVACAAIALAGCGPTRHSQTLTMGGQPVPNGQLSAAEVRAQVRVQTRDGRTIYRAPTLAVSERLDLQRGTMMIGSGLGQADIGSSGYLTGSRSAPGAPVRQRVVYQWDLVEGEGRYAKVTLADGRELPFRATSTGGGDQPEARSFPVIQTLIIELPDDVLRGAATTGLTLTVTLDNGYAFTVTTPAAYVQGYLQAVDAPLP